MDNSTRLTKGRTAAKLFAKDIRNVTGVPARVRNEPWLDRDVAALIHIKRQDNTTDFLLPVYYSESEEASLRDAVRLLQPMDLWTTRFMEGAICCIECRMTDIKKARPLRVVVQENVLTWQCDAVAEHHAPVGRLIDMYESQTEENSPLPSPIGQALQRLSVIEALIDAQKRAIKMLGLVELAEDRGEALNLLQAQGIDSYNAQFILDLRFDQLTRKNKAATVAERAELLRTIEELRG